MRALFVLGLLALATPVPAQSELQDGFAAALRGCEEWVLNPSSWATGVGPFLSAVGLGDKMGAVDKIDEAALPPQQLRRANHFWRINSTPGAGYILVVSDQLPMCHITGGGDTDLQPIVQSVLASTDFKSRWERVREATHGDMVATEFRSHEEPQFSILISRAKGAGQRSDRVQVVATAILNARPH